MAETTIKEKLSYARFDLLGATLMRADAKENLQEAWEYFILCGDQLEDAQMEVENARNIIRDLRTEQKRSI